MKKTFAFAFFLAVALATPARAQLTAPNAAGISFGHIHLYVSDVPAQQKFWTTLGGVPTANQRLQMIQVLGAAYKASKRDEEGYTPLSELGQRAKAVSSFAARNYGYTRLSDLIRAVPNFEVKSGDDGRLLVKRLR